jgi:hypothetical protein
MTVLLSLVLAPAAQGHLGRTRPPGYVSRVNRIVGVAGMRARANSTGLLTLLAPPGHDVVVLGYVREPYLRFVGGAVYENEHSLTAFVNRGLAPPRSSGRSAPPLWRRVARGRRWAWHDHRIHWMSAAPPPLVRSSPHRPHHIFGWTVGMRVDDRPAAIVGELDWRPTAAMPGVWWWLGLALVTGMTVYGAYHVLWKGARTAPVRS